MLGKCQLWMCQQLSQVFITGSMDFRSACGRLVGVVKSRSSNSMSFSVAEFLEFFEVS